MKIGILTFWWSNDNYGQILQAYALQTVLEKMGHNVFLIQYDRRKDIESSFFIKLRTLFGIIKKDLGLSLLKNIRNKNENKNMLRCFDGFRDKYLHLSNKYYSYQEIKLSPPNADVYIVGSDQVWYLPSESFYKLHNWANTYFLNFGSKDVKRIAYAASFSMDVYPSFCEYVAPLLKSFSLVTVREKSGINACLKCGLKGAIQVYDPTLLLTKDDWLKISSNRENKEKYLLLYLLGNKSTISLHDIYRESKEHELLVKYVASQGKTDNYEKIHPTIEDFLSLIKNSTYFITNSFHGTVFSIIFNVNFLVVPLEGKVSSMNERIFSLLDSLNLRNRILISQNDIYLQLEETIDWKSINEKLLSKRLFILELLQKHI